MLSFQLENRWWLICHPGGALNLWHFRIVIKTIARFHAISLLYKKVMFEGFKLHSAQVVGMLSGIVFVLLESSLNIPFSGSSNQARWWHRAWRREHCAYWKIRPFCQISIPDAEDTNAYTPDWKQTQISCKLSVSMWEKNDYFYFDFH